jgi:hypothetical protein
MTTDTNASVESMFSDIAVHFHRGDLCRNPVTGGEFVYGEDPLAPQKEEARKALQAREWFAKHGPPDAQPLPLSQSDIEDMKYRHTAPNPALSHIIYRYTVSLRDQGWDYERHPSFEDFAQGVMAVKDAPVVPRVVAEDEGLLRRYPPRPLKGLTPYLLWQPPKQYERTMKDYRDSEARRARRRAA